MSSPRRRVRENATEVVSLLVTGIWLAALLTDQGWWLPFMLVGYIVVVPLVSLLADDESEEEAWWGDDDEADTEPANGKTALQTLRERYARGELTDEEFERKLDRLLETEAVEDLEAIDRRSERDPELK